MELENYLEDAVRQLHKLKDLADKAVNQIADAQLFEVLDKESNSIAIIMKHMAGNMRSRWSNFLTSDGEKPDRFRDKEFVIEEEETKDSILGLWDAGWQCVLAAVSSLQAQDLHKTVRIRGEAHSVVEAINRQLTHYAYHVGQIVLLAKYFTGAKWQTLSIPRGKSQEFEVSKKGARYEPKPNNMQDGT